MTNHTGTAAHYEHLTAQALGDFATLASYNLSDFYEAGDCLVWRCSETEAHGWLAIPCDAATFVLRRPEVGAHAISADGAGLACSIITMAQILMRNEGSNCENFLLKQMARLLDLLKSHPESEIIRKFTGLAA